MSKFKVGDKVRILDGSKIKRYAGGWNNIHMSNHIGKVYKVEAVHEHWADNSYAGYRLNVKGLCAGCIWDERGLELVTEQKFKVGDKVRAKKNAPYGITTNGWVGKVISVHKDSIKVFGKGVIIDPKEVGSGFNVNPDYFELIPEQKIVITTDGKTTTAALYDGKQKIKEAKAVCAPSDTFDFNYGSTLALDRLTGFVRSSVDITLDTRSQMDKFIAGEIAIEVPNGEAKNFLKECERRGLKWRSGQLPTAINMDEKYFICEDNDLFYSLAGRSDTGYVWETWDGKTSKKNPKDIYKELQTLLRILDDFND